MTSESGFRATKRKRGTIAIDKMLGEMVWNLKKSRTKYCQLFSRRYNRCGMDTWQEVKEVFKPESAERLWQIVAAANVEDRIKTVAAACGNKVHRCDCSMVKFKGAR